MRRQRMMKIVQIKCLRIAPIACLRAIDIWDSPRPFPAPLTPSAGLKAATGTILIPWKLLIPWMGFVFFFYFRALHFPTGSMEQRDQYSGAPL
jgi:hypothetical protein